MGPLSNLQRRARELLGLGSPAPAGDLAPVPAQTPAGPSPDRRPAVAGRAKADESLHLRPTHREELHSVVRMILSQAGRAADDVQVDDFLRFAAPRRLDLSLVRVADRRGRVLWALLPVVSPGHTALLLAPPTPHRPVELAAAGELIDQSCADLRAGGTRLAQVLLDPDDATARDLYAAHGFGEMAELTYLAGEPHRPPTDPPLPPGFAWVTYDEQATHELFKRVIAATYQGSLDCPALNGFRDLEDVVAGHRASGEFDPRLWRVLVEAGPAAAGPPVPLGVLLLAPIPTAGALELVYLGLVPAARGRRLGDLLLRRAIAGVAECGMQRLTLAVDARNAPALKLYYRHGLACVGSKLAMMRDLARDDSEGRRPHDEVRTPADD